jgi:hypothetical protein
MESTASVTIRKQKQIFMFEFEAEIYFKAVHLQDDRQDVMGRIKLFEFNQDDDEVQTELHCEKGGPWPEKVKQFMRKQMPDIIFKRSMKLLAAMKERDMDEQRLAEARAKEKEALETYKKVN